MFQPLVRSIRKGKAEINRMYGLNYSDSYKDGSLAETLNMSSRRYPYLTTRKGREQVTSTRWSKASSIFSWEKMLVIDENNNVYYDDSYVGTLGQVSTDRQFAVVNTKLVIFPDKKYIDLNTHNSIQNLGETITIAASSTFSSTSIKKTGATFGTLKEGDAVFITGCTTFPSNNKEDGAIIVKEIKTNEIVFDGEAIFKTGTETGTVHLERRVPDLDYICESENRLWGCSNDSKTVMASALGDPTVWYDYSGESTDSYAMSIGSEGKFTGICTLGSSILVWKANMLHKILGSFPAEYTLYTYKIAGVADGSFRSMEVINETLFYLNDHGVYSYSGGTTSLVSYALGEFAMSDGVGGVDGDMYYLCANNNGTRVLLAYDIRHDAWIKEDDTNVIEFARLGTEIYFLNNEGKIYRMNANEDESFRWIAQYKPFYETIAGKKVYSKVIVRVSLEKNSHMEVMVRTDGSLWKSVKTIRGEKEDIVSVAIPIARCDKFEIRLEGKGSATILGLYRDYRVGSDK